MHREELVQPEQFGCLFQFKIDVSSTECSVKGQMYRAVLPPRGGIFRRGYQQTQTSCQQLKCLCPQLASENLMTLNGSPLHKCVFFSFMVTNLSKLNLTSYSKVQEPFARPPSHRSILIIFGVAHQIITVKRVQILVNFLLIMCCNIITTFETS